MRHQNINRIFLSNILATVLMVILAGCSTEQVPGSQLATGKPALLRAIDNSILSVVVRIEDSGLEFIGQQREDGSWYVQMGVASNQTHVFVAAWYANLKEQKLLVVEQRGEFFAGPTRVQSDAVTMDVSDGIRFDADCDGVSNLQELETMSDPLSSPGCSGDSQTTGADSSADGIGGTDGSDGSTDSNGTTSGTDTMVEPTDTGATDTGNSGNSGDSSDPDSSDPVVSAVMPELQPIPAGCFQMGSPDSDPYRQENERQHPVCVEAFLIGKYEVTFDQYSEFAEQPGAVQTVPSDNNWGAGSRPVINVTWRNAVLYTQWLSELSGDSYRLPTEAEWEYAARGGTQTRFWTGNTLRDDQENFNSSSSWGDGIATGESNPGTTLPVGSLEPNPFGLYDMLGNVIEFTCSSYSDNYENNLEQQCDYDMSLQHVVRGAAYNYDASWARSSMRTGLPLPDEVNGHVGFRVVRENR